MGELAQVPGPMSDDDRALCRSVSDALGQFFRGELQGFSTEAKFLEFERERSDAAS